MSDMSKEVELLFPQGKKVPIGDETLTIMPFSFGQFPKVLACLEGVGDMLDVRQSDGTLVQKKLEIEELMVRYSDKILELCALATGKPLTYFNKISLTEGLDLCQAIIEVNADFFVKRLQPKMVTVMQNLSALVGAVSSQGLSKPDTP